MYPFIQTHGGMLLSVWLLLRTCIHTISLPSACPGVAQQQGLPQQEHQRQQQQQQPQQPLSWQSQQPLQQPRQQGSLNAAYQGGRGTRPGTYPSPEAALGMSDADLMMIPHDGGSRRATTARPRLVFNKRREKEKEKKEVEKEERVERMQVDLLEYKAKWPVNSKLQVYLRGEAFTVVDIRDCGTTLEQETWRGTAYTIEQVSTRVE